MKSIAIVALLFAVSVAAQDKPKDPPKPPEVKAEVKVDLLKAQNELWKLNAQLRQLQDQMKSLQDQFTAEQAKYQQSVAGALQKSGIDDKQWMLNPDTLDVTARPQEAPKAAEKKP
jgi:uncharacterized protein (DUF3084 family)